MAMFGVDTIRNVRVDGVNQTSNSVPWFSISKF